MKYRAKKASKDDIGDASTLSRVSSNSQQLVSSQDGGYDNPPIPYIPLPDEPIPTRKMATTPTYSRPAIASRDLMKTNAFIVLLAVIIGAGLGAALAYLLKGDLVTWALIGVGIGIVIAFIIPALADEETSRELGAVFILSLPDLFNGCTFSFILILSGSGLICALLLMHNWLLS